MYVLHSELLCRRLIFVARVYGQTRMDTFWQFREAYETARKIKVAQDEYCEAASTGKWDDSEGKEFPNDLKWEALVDVLRGKVKVDLLFCASSKVKEIAHRNF